MCKPNPSPLDPKFDHARRLVVDLELHGTQFRVGAGRLILRDPLPPLVAAELAEHLEEVIDFLTSGACAREWAGLYAANIAGRPTRFWEARP